MVLGRRSSAAALRRSSLPVHHPCAPEIQDDRSDDTHSAGSAYRARSGSLGGPEDLRDDAMVGGWRRGDLRKLHDAFLDVCQGYYAGPQDMPEVLLTAFPALGPDNCARISMRIFECLDPYRQECVMLCQFFAFITGTDLPEDALEDLMTQDEIELDTLIALRREVARNDPDVRQFGTPQTPREWVWAVTDQPASQFYRAPPLGSGPWWLVPAAWAFAIATQAAIVTSTLIMIIESTADMQQEDGDSGNTATFALEALCVSLFTVEFMLRVCSCPLHKEECRGPMKTQEEFWKMGWTWVDVTSILPFYLEVTGATPRNGQAKSLLVLRVLRMAKIIRALRVLKIGRNAKGIQMMAVAIHRVRGALAWMVVVIAMGVTLFASLMYHAEKVEVEWNYETNKWVRCNNSQWIDRGKEIFFQSIPHAMWWAIVTVTTVGYGDTYPVTGWGKFIGSVAILSGIVLLAYPTTVLTNVFADVQDEDRVADKKAKERDRLREEVKKLNEAAQDPPEAAARSPRADKLLSTGSMLSLSASPSRTLSGSPRGQRSGQRNSSSKLGKLNKLSRKGSGHDTAAAWPGSPGSTAHSSRGDMADPMSPGGQQAASAEYAELSAAMTQVTATLGRMQQGMEELARRQQGLEDRIGATLDRLRQSQTLQREELTSRVVCLRDELLQTYRDCHEPEDVRRERERLALQDRIRELVTEIEPLKAAELERRFAQLLGRSDEMRLLRDFLAQLNKRVAAQARRQNGRDCPDPFLFPSHPT